MTTTTRDDLAYQKALGANLRTVREGLGWKLRDMAEKSDGLWVGVVVGSYERGDRAISVARLHGLCAFYGTSVPAVLPEQWATAADVEVLARRVLSETLKLVGTPAEAEVPQ